MLPSSSLTFSEGGGGLAPRVAIRHCHLQILPQPRHLLQQCLPQGLWWLATQQERSWLLKLQRLRQEVLALAVAEEKGRRAHSKSTIICGEQAQRRWVGGW